MLTFLADAPNLWAVVLIGIGLKILYEHGVLS